MKKPLVLIAIIVFSLLFLPLLAEAEILDSGTCGKLTWTLTDDYTLTISGEGVIPNDVHPWNGYNNEIKSVVIGEGVTRIGNSSITGMTNLTSISFPQSLTSIGSFCFSDCHSLQAITFPNNLQKIEYSSFADCTSLATIHIPSSLTSIEFFCFEGNSSQTSFTVDEGNQSYCSSDGVLFTKDMKRLHCYPIGNPRSTYSIPDGVDSLGECVFSGCTYLSSVSLPNSLRRISISAFSGCVGITSIKLPIHLEFMNSGVFQGTSITEITLPESLTYMGDSMFPNGTLIKCVKGSYSDNWAQEYGFDIEYISHQQYFIKHEKVEPTYTTTGTEEYWECQSCGKLYSDSEGIHEISEPIVIPMLKRTDINGATISSFTAQVYTGKPIKPEVTVTYDGKKLTEGSDYSLSYKNNKKIGTATITVYGEGAYSGSKDASFIIIPKAVTLSSLTAGKESLTVKWKRGSNIDGYEIQYSVKKNFKSSKTVTITKAKTTSTIIEKLKKGKTYYVRIRTYKKVGGKMYYSEWSKELKKKVK